MIIVRIDSIFGLAKWFSNCKESYPNIRIGRTNSNSNISVDVEFNDHELAVMFMLSTNGYVPAKPFIEQVP